MTQTLTLVESEYTNSVVPMQPTNNPLDLPEAVFTAALDRRKANRISLLKWIQSSLVEGVDWGRVNTKRGPSKPSLFKPGAEKICGMLGVTVHYPALNDYETAAINGIEVQNIILRCELHDASGRVIAHGIGARKVSQDYGVLNTSLKMSAKSAMIDATLRLAGLSELFTQDIEDLTNETQEIKTPVAQQSNTINPAQLAKIQFLLNDLNLSESRVLAYCQKIASVKALPAMKTLSDLDVQLYQYLIEKLPDLAARSQSATTAT